MGGTSPQENTQFELVFPRLPRSDVTPVQKVLGLMEGMKAKGKEEMVAEQEQPLARGIWFGHAVVGAPFFLGGDPQKGWLSTFGFPLAARKGVPPKNDRPTWNAFGSPQSIPRRLLAKGFTSLQLNMDPNRMGGAKGED